MGGGDGDDGGGGGRAATWCLRLAEAGLEPKIWV